MEASLRDLSWCEPRVPVSEAALSLTSMIFSWCLGDRIQQTFISRTRHSNQTAAIVTGIVAVAIMFAGLCQGGKLLADLWLEEKVTPAIRLAFMALYTTLPVPPFRCR